MKTADSLLCLLFVFYVSFILFSCDGDNDKDIETIAYLTIKSYTIDYEIGEMWSGREAKYMIVTDIVLPVTHFILKLEILKDLSMKTDLNIN